MRAFFALPLPEMLLGAVDAVQQALPCGRLVPKENLHVTLHFLGEMRDDALEDAHGAALALRPEPVWLALAGLGSFACGNASSLHAVVAPDPGLSALHAGLRSRLRGASIELPRRRFRPHVTIARLRGKDPETAARLSLALEAHAGLRTRPVPVRAFALYASLLRPEGAVYEELARYPLPLATAPVR